MFNLHGWLQLGFFVAVLALITKPLGLYLIKVLDPQGRTWLDPLLKPLERLLYRLGGIDNEAEQSWQRYTMALLVFSLLGFLMTYAVLRLQQWLPLNPQHFGPMSPHQAFNTAASFTTNTNWQSYGGESTLSYFSQMVGLTYHNFVSAAVGIAVAAALTRGIVRHGAATVGNFWVDLVRVNLYLLLPICLLLATCFMAEGMIQNFKAYDTVSLVEQVAGGPQTQVIAQGPVASQEAIKMLGTNGGGFMNANSAHPYENPTPLTNFLEMLAIFMIPSALTYYFGCSVRHKAHGWTIWAVMLALFLAGVLSCWWAEGYGNPRLSAYGIEQVNLEGKELRFGIAATSLFTAVTTDASCGAVNGMFDSFTPLGGLVPMVNIQLGELIFGGVGSGLYGMLIFVVVTIFLAGLMVGRTPEYLGKKIEAFDVKASALYLMVPVLTILGLTAVSAAASFGLSSLNNAGPHGLSEMLYAFSSGTGNNGSAFAGLNAATPWYDTAIGFSMLFGRFLMIVPVMALAGSLAAKKRLPESHGGFPLAGGLFAALLVGVIVIVGALTFFPALALGPIVEHLLMLHSGILY